MFQSKSEQVVAKAHNAEMKQSENKRGVSKRHSAKMEQLDTFTNTNQIDLLSRLSDGQKAIPLA